MISYAAKVNCVPLTSFMKEELQDDVVLIPPSIQGLSCSPLRDNESKQMRPQSNSASALVVSSFRLFPLHQIILKCIGEFCALQVCNVSVHMLYGDIRQISDWQDVSVEVVERYADQLVHNGLLKKDGDVYRL
jgi:hypothetical protein